MLETDYSHKIKTVSELKQIFGQGVREHKVIMCHGSFDVVHPGHVRHLIYARSKADTLIASLTADIHIEKGPYRPYVPEDIRALNLAALEPVDYVVIDREPTPLKLIGLLQPDYFAKGFEYVDGGLHHNTQEEVRVVESYGGEVIFTPGDIVFSSSALLNLAQPDIRDEKLITLMNAEGITFDSLRAAITSMAGKRVHVVGDTIVDSRTHTSLIGGQTKTPTFSVRYEGRSDYVGGAGIVAKHLSAAGADVTFSTVLGDDEIKEMVLADLASAGIACLPIIDSARPTTIKNVFVAGGYHLLKVDTVDNSSVTDATAKTLAESVNTTPVDAVVFSDFRHGIFNRRTTQMLTDSIPSGVFRVADSQVASRWGNIMDFQDFDLITPNEREARSSLGDQDSGIRPLAASLYRKARCGTLILKLGDRGVLTCRSKIEQDIRSTIVVDSFADRVEDAVGAGDALLAYATLVMLESGSAVEATILGSLAAALECEIDGNIPVSQQNVVERLTKIEKRIDFNAN